MDLAGNHKRPHSVSMTAALSLGISRNPPLAIVALGLQLVRVVAEYSTDEQEHNLGLAACTHHVG